MHQFFERSSESGHALVTVFRFFCQCFKQHLFHHVWQIVDEGVGTGEGVAQVFDHHRGGCISGVGPVTGDHLIKDDSERVNIGAGVSGAHPLFGSHVVGGADAHTGDGELGGAASGDDLGNAEIGEQRRAGLAHEDVGRFYVAVDDLLFVGIFQCAGDGGEQGGGLLVGHGGTHLLLERAAGDEGHHQVGHAVLFAVIQHFENVRVVELCQRAGFALKALEEFAFVALFHIRANDLDGDVSLEAGIIGFINGGHAALSKRLNDVVASQVLTSQILLAHNSPPCA